MDYQDRETVLEFKDLVNDHIGLILFTSGSTGTPKGVPLTHNNLIGNIESTLKKHLIRQADTLAFNIPFRFISAISHFFPTMMVGGKLVCSEKSFLPKDFLNFVKSNGVTAFGGAPIQIRTILQGLKFDEDLKNNLKWIMSSGDHLPHQLIEEIFRVSPEIKIVSAYGLTELAGRFFMNPITKESLNSDSLGTPIEGLTYLVVDEQMNPVTNGETGEVIVSGPLSFSGYLNDLESSKTAFHHDYFRTGDLGYQTSNDDLILTGRCQDVFKVSGLKVATQKLNSALMELNIFTDAAIFPYVDPVIGTVPMLLYVAPTSISLADVLTALKEKLPQHYLPRKIKRVDRIPRTGSGKIQRKQLADLAQ